MNTLIMTRAVTVAAVLAAVLAAAAPVQAQSINAVPDSGSAVAGAASTPIANVSGNDSVNGAAATLGPSGDATVAQLGTWPAGIVLNTASGAVTATAAVAPGSYSFQYQLCDLNTPPDCASATDTVIVSAAIVANSDSGMADAGIASRPIADVAANDTINGAAAVLGSAGNGTVAPLGTWPAGIALNPGTGAVSTTVAVAPGAYSVQYQLCDKSSPPDCAAATDTVTVITASIVPNPDSGTADAGIASRPIANVAANDTVDGAAAILGSTGNATVSETGTWPAGIALTASTGAVSTTVAVAPGSYPVQYKLCDRNVPADCVATTDTVTVISPSIVPNPDSGTADAGVASRPIANVAANDTVNGAAASLGSAGNSTVSQAGTWPAGIALNGSTGAVSTTLAVAPGTYSFQYKLCDKNVPADCVSATDTVTVITAAIVPSPDSGTTAAGMSATAIANVAANDTVHGAPATLGSSGNASVAKAGTWAAGIALNTATGAVTTGPGVPAGTYQLQYQLCDKNAPPSCAGTTDSVTVMQTFTEVQATPDQLGDDIHFDWGRDGLFCASCNYGQGNARYVWSDEEGNLWVGHVDPTSGAFTPQTGQNELADTSAFYFAEFGDGPDFAFSTQNGQVISQLVYNRYTPGQAAVPANAGIGFATPVQGGWNASFVPGSMDSTANGGPANSVFYAQSQCTTDPVASALFYDFATPTQVFSEPLTVAGGTAPTLTPFGAFATFISGGKPGARWVPCTHQLVFAGAAPADASGNVYQQIFWYDVDTQTVQQLTVDSNQHAEAFLFQAPELGDNYILYTTINNLEIDVYEQTGVGANGAPLLTLVNQIRSPDPTEPYINETEPFINCTPACQTYIFMKLQSTVATAGNVTTVPNGLAITNINPAQPFFEILVPTSATPTIERTNPKYYITAQGPYIYYDRNTVSSPKSQFQQHGRYYINTHLGAPSGACLGSSAESGLLPGC